MIFGDRRIFAIEAIFLEIYGKWTYGRLRFWFNELPIGDFDDTADLAGSARWGRTFLTASSRRTRIDLEDMLSPDLFESLYGRFVELVITLNPKPLPGYWDQDPYVLDEVGESSLRDKYSVIVVRRGDGSDRMLIMCYREERLLERMLPAGFCDDVVASYCSWAEDLRTASA
jgi:hypothetical protein